MKKSHQWAFSNEMFVSDKHNLSPSGTGHPPPALEHKALSVQDKGIGFVTHWKVGEPSPSSSSQTISRPEIFTFSSEHQNPNVLRWVDETGLKGREVKKESPITRYDMFKTVTSTSFSEKKSKKRRNKTDEEKSGIRDGNCTREMNKKKTRTKITINDILN